MIQEQMGYKKTNINYNIKEFDNKNITSAPTVGCDILLLSSQVRLNSNFSKLIFQSQLLDCKNTASITQLTRKSIYYKNRR